MPRLYVECQGEMKLSGGKGNAYGFLEIGWTAVRIEAASALPGAPGNVDQELAGPVS